MGRKESYQTKQKYWYNKYGTAPVEYVKGSHVELFKSWYISVSEGCFILAISVYLDEMQHYAAFHLGLHCLPKYLIRGFQYT